MAALSSEAGSSSERSDRVAMVRSLECIRTQCGKVRDLARCDKLNHFRVNLNNMDKVVAFVQGLMDRDYTTYDDVPYHSRWRHFEVGGVDRAKALKDTWDSQGIYAAFRINSQLQLKNCITGYHMFQPMLDVFDTRNVTYGLRHSEWRRLRRKYVALSFLGIIEYSLLSWYRRVPIRMNSIGQWTKKGIPRDFFTL